FAQYNDWCWKPKTELIQVGNFDVVLGSGRSLKFGVSCSNIMNAEVDGE
ncbi:hypothetical protein L195_g046503, partial [Trifolium pratense]